jgi:hypothetical protein
MKIKAASLLDAKEDVAYHGHAVRNSLLRKGKGTRLFAYFLLEVVKVLPSIC